MPDEPIVDVRMADAPMQCPDDPIARRSDVTLAPRVQS